MYRISKRTSKFGGEEDWV